MPVRDLADIQRIEAEPLATRGLPRTTYEVFTASAQRWPDRKALSFFLTADTYQRASTWTYAELLAEITRSANALHAFGVSADHPVAYVLPNLPETHFTIWGGEAAGVVLAVNPLLEPDLIVEILRAAKVRVLVTLAPFPGAELWSKLAPHLSALSELRVVALVDAMTYLGGAGGTAVAAAAASVPDAKFDIVDFRAAMQGQPADRLVAPRTITEHSVSSYFCTGGTTGAPKIAVRTHGNEVFDAWAAAQVFGEREEPRTYFCGLPLFHVNAQLATGLLPWMHGHHVLLATPEGYRGKNLIARFWEIAAHYRIATFSGVPTIYAALLEAPIGDNDISSLEYAICGAAPMPAKLIEAFEAKTGLKIVEGYGLTEGTCVSCLNPPEGKRRAGSIGLRLPYQQMRAVILDDAGTLPANGGRRRGRNDRHHRAQRVRGLSRSAAEQGSVDRHRRLALAQHRRSRATGWSGLFLAGRPAQGADHQGRAQHRSEADRGCAVETPSRGDGGRRRQPRRLCRRGPCRLCAAQTRRCRQRPGTDGFRRGPRSRAGGDPKAREDHAVAAGDRDRQDLQAGPSATRDRGRCSQRGAKCGRNHRRLDIRTQPPAGTGRAHPPRRRVCGSARSSGAICL